MDRFLILILTSRRRTMALSLLELPSPLVRLGAGAGVTAIGTTAATSPSTTKTILTKTTSTLAIETTFPAGVANGSTTLHIVAARHTVIERRPTSLVDELASSRLTEIGHRPVTRALAQPEDSAVVVI